MQPKVLIPQDITEAGKRFLREKGYEVFIGSGSDEDTICREVVGCDAILARTAPYTRRIMEAGKNLKVIGRYGAGTDNIDIQAATDLGIWVTNAPIANSNAVAEHTITMLLACAKNATRQDAQTRAGNWDSRNKLQSMEVEGKVLGLIGLGRIGRIVAHKACLGLGMRVIGYDAYMLPENVPDEIEVKASVEDVFREADFVSLHVPLSSDTKGFVKERLLGLMKRSACLINCSRGEVIAEEDLLKALVSGSIRCAGLDVFVQEPVSIDNPLLKLDNVILSPHNAALTSEAMDRMGVHAATGIDEILRGKKPTWPVNRIG